MPEPGRHTRRSFLRAAAGCAAHVMLLGAAAPAQARRLFARTRGAVIAQEPWGRLERVAEGVWAMVSTPLVDRTTLSNGGIIQGRSGVLVVEGFAQPEGASWLARQARTLTGRWPDEVVLTHYHGDHVGGIAGLVDAGGAAPRLRLTDTTRALVREADGRRPAPPAGERARLLGAAVALPADGTTTIDLGDRRVRVVPRDGHTRSDVTVELDDPAVVFCGDLVWNAMFPNYVDAVPSRLSRAVAALVQASAPVYVPGHGPVADAADLQLYVAVLDAIEAAAAEARARGQSAAEAAASFRLPAEAAEWTLFSPRYFETAIGAWLKEAQ